MTKPWHKHYEKGVVTEIDISRYSSIAELIEESLEKYKNRVAFHCMGTNMTYADLDEKSKNFASYLQNELGLKKGDIVALMMPNILQFPICFFGALRAGVTLANVNPLYTARELQHQLKDSGAKAIVILANFAHVLEKVLKQTPVEHVVVTELGDMLSFPKSIIVNLVVKHVKKMVPKFSLPEAISFKDALRIGESEAPQKPDTKHHDVAFLQYTGGTTGVSKGAMLTHANLIANMLQAEAWLINKLDPEIQSIVITPLPLYHIFSMTANCLVFTKRGGLNVLITNPKDIPAFVKELANWKFSLITGVNTLFNALLNNEDFKKLDFSSLQIALGGGMAVQKAVADRWKQVTKVPLIEAYGLTEASPAVCINPMNITEFNGYIGLPIPSTDLRIVGEDGKDVASGEPGELWVKGPQVMAGYYNRPDETAKTITSDGWLKTGDIATLGDDGFVKIVDRKKDMIIVSGFNVYPNEIEDVVAHHPGVLEVAAVGIPSEKSGEEVKIFVVPRTPTLSKDEVLSYCKENLTGYKVPRHIEFRNELPKTNVGKILRRALRDGAIQ
ncbi:MAG: AMP-binding protein [Oligoflexales bacterium]|nr:AMP-binding protein [Oligoflexales bacterium]